MLKNLKSLFIVSEDEDEEKVEPETEASAETQSAPQNSSSGQTPPPIPQNPQSSSSSQKGMISERVMDKLMGVLDKHNAEGFDYLEFKKSLKALAKMPMDEKTKFQSAFATASTMGATVPKIVSSIDYYKKILAQENSNFLKTVNDQIDLKVKGREEQIQKLQDMIAEKSELIKKLTEEITAHQTQISEISGQINADKEKIELTSSDFTETYNFLLDQIDQDMVKIKQYLS
ncbi:MAG: hypothetical protein MRY83_23645 [Flavobacteriales bacterium]|nr:hypothetical protein [Flavobacteriales bacterium]